MIDFEAEDRAVIRALQKQIVEMAFRHEDELAEALALLREARPSVEYDASMSGALTERCYEILARLDAFLAKHPAPSSAPEAPR